MNKFGLGLFFFTVATFSFSSLAQMRTEFKSAANPEKIATFTGDAQASLMIDSDYGISLGKNDKAVRGIGVTSTRGLSDFHIVFHPGRGYSIYGTGSVRGFVDEAGNTKAPFEKGVFFHGVGFSNTSPVNLNLSSPGSVVSFDRSMTGGKVGFKVLEFELMGPALVKNQRFLRVLVTEGAEVVPLSVTSTSMRDLLPGDVNPSGKNSFDAEAFLRKKLFKFTEPSGRAGYPVFEQIGDLNGRHFAKIAVSDQALKVIESADFDVSEQKDVWKVFGQKFNRVLVREAIFSNYYAKETKVGRFEHYLSESNPEGLKDYRALHDFKPIDVSSLKVIESIGGNEIEKVNTDFSKELMSQIDYVRHRSLSQPDALFPETIQFDLSTSREADLRSIMGFYGENAFWVDLDFLQSHRNGYLVLDDLEKLRQSNQSFFLVTVSHLKAEIGYFGSFSQNTFSQILRREFRSDCSVALSGAAKNAESLHQN